MPRKKVDERVRVLIENNVKTHTRSFFVIVGDRGKDQVVNLHYILSKAQVKARPSMLWCYNKELGFSTHRQKRMKQIKKLQAKGLYDQEKDDPFELFVSSTQIRWCYYKESAKILGNTYGMAVLQDFDAITPNILCRTIETVEGGGVVVLLLRTMSSLKQLYSMAMEVHSRFRTEAHQDVIPRFNERFLLSLASCQSCLVLDDELNVLPISKASKNIVPLEITDGTSKSNSFDTGGYDFASLGITMQKEETSALTPAQKELKALKTSMASTPLVGNLVNCTRTLDQAKAIMTFAEAISEKTLRSTVALTAGRGRGKSAALGLSIAAAVAYGYSNIFVTSPSPENLRTLFEFVFKGLEALSYKEHADYEAVGSTNPELNGAIVRVNIFKGHRQTVQYIDPADADRLTQAELVVVDEAAAIPLPLVKRLLGPYLVFMASTVNGYEGTGRSLSLKLVQQLRLQQSQAGADDASAAASLSGVSRTLREVTLSEPIRYAQGDLVEKWLNELLCLDATEAKKLRGRLPAPASCELYAVDRDSLFSYHRVSEAFLHRMMSLYVSSHYKNSPNDLQLMSDAPAHRLFVLLGPQGEKEKEKNEDDDGVSIPDVLCVIQVAFEGRISRDSMAQTLGRGARASGDLIPWTVAQQFQDNSFGQLSGARIVRIAVHPDAAHMGYGTRAMQLLTAFYSGQLNFSLGSNKGEDEEVVAVDTGDVFRSSEKDKDNDGETTLLNEKLKPRKRLPSLLVPAADITFPEKLHWLGTSFGLTLPLFSFWQKQGLVPLYLRQTPNELTAEHTMLMLRPIYRRKDSGSGSKLEQELDKINPVVGWERLLAADFGRRVAVLMGSAFRHLDATLALAILSSTSSHAVATGSSQMSDEKKEEDSQADGQALMVPAEVSAHFSPHDLKRLESYARNLVDYHLVMDLIPTVAKLYFNGRIPVHIPRVQSGILLALGLQNMDVDAASAAFGIQANQAMAMFNKAVKKFSVHLNNIIESGVRDKLKNSRLGINDLSTTIITSPTTPGKPITSNEPEKKEKENQKRQRTELEEDLAEYVVPSEEAFAAALSGRSADEVPRNVALKSEKELKEKKEKKEKRDKNDEDNENTYSGRVDLLEKKGSKKHRRD